MWARIQATRAFVAGLGVELRDEVLPLSPTALHLQPFWLAPALAMARR
jgi:hypothetical protein